MKVFFKVLLASCLFIGFVNANELTLEEKQNVVELVTSGHEYMVQDVLSSSLNSKVKEFQINCFCKALDARFDSVCRSLPFSQCSRVGNITCYKMCR